MQFIIEGIRKIVVLVLLMELVLQLQAGKAYEPYIKMLIGIMVIYSLVSGVVGAVGNWSGSLPESMQEFQWAGSWYTEFEEAAKEEVQRDAGQQIAEKRIEAEVNIPEIKIDRIEIQGGTP